MPPYRFRKERIIDTIKNVAGPPYSVAEIEACTEVAIGEEGDTDDLLMLTSGGVDLLAVRLEAAAQAHDPRYGARHRDLLHRLRRHDGCGKIVEELQEERGDVIGSMLETRLYLMNGLTVSSEGALACKADKALDLLRPAIREESDWKGWIIVDTDPAECPECWAPYGHGHDPACLYGAESDDNLWTRVQRLL